MATTGNAAPPPPPPPRGASTQAPADQGRPPLPDRLLLKGKNIKAVALGDSVTFGMSAAKNVQIAIPYRVVAGQRALFYSVTKEMAAAGHKPGDYGEIPEGTILYYTKALTPDAAPYAVDALRYSGWEGSDFTMLQAGKAEGLGGTADAPVEVRLTVDVQEKDGRDGSWRKDKEGNFAPWQSVEWVNKIAGMNFAEEAAPDDLKKLSREMAGLLRPPAGKAKAPAAAKPAPKTPAAPAAPAAKPATAAPPPPARAASTPGSTPSPSDIPPDADDEGGGDLGDDDIPF